jgi:hypothetical protein
LRYELELDLWVLLLHAKGDGDSMRAGGCDIHNVVGYYAKLCNSSSNAAEITRGKPKKQQREVRGGEVLEVNKYLHSD